jgi:hypothetical protein
VWHQDLSHNPCRTDVSTPVHNNAGQ